MIECFFKGIFIAVITLCLIGLGIGLLELIGYYPSVIIILFVLCMCTIGFFAEFVSDYF